MSQLTLYLNCTLLLFFFLKKKGIRQIHEILGKYFATFKIYNNMFTLRGIKYFS